MFREREGVEMRVELRLLKAIKKYKNTFLELYAEFQKGKKDIEQYGPEEMIGGD